MKSKIEQLLKLMHVLAWIAFIGLMIKTGSILLSYYVSIGNPQAAADLYQGLDLSVYRQNSLTHYTMLVVYKAILYGAQAYVAFLLVGLLSKLNIAQPFNTTNVQLLKKISYAILCVWLVAMVHNIHLSALERMYGWVAVQLSGEFIFMAGVVYVLAQLFKRGVVLQSENELTI